MATSQKTATTLVIATTSLRVMLGFWNMVTHLMQ